VSGVKYCFFVLFLPLFLGPDMGKSIIIGSGGGLGAYLSLFDMWFLLIFI